MSYLAYVQWFDGRRGRWLIRFAVLVLALAMLPLSGVGLGKAHAATGDPTGVQVTLQGCRATESALIGTSLPLICASTQYTTGNLGPGWNELDLVPHRLTLAAQNSAPATQTYNIAVMADYNNATSPGYDVITQPALSVTSPDSCAMTSGPQLTTAGTNGGSKSIYRILTVTQAANTTCVFDYDERLALGSSGYPGSSLHSNVANQQLGTAGIGSRDVSIPVNAIAPQSVDKTVTASRGADAVWSVVKTANPANLHFGDTCLSTTSFSQGVDITVTWTKTVTASGDATVVTQLLATNPSHRTITVDVSDAVTYDGGAYTVDTGPVDVPALTTGYLVGSDTRTITTSGSTVGDTATATYTDKLTGIPIPGTTTVSKTTAIQSNGSVTNDTATITDSESISGAGLTFSVADPGVGSFTNYTADDATTGPVDWSSGTVSDSGSVTFHKTVYLDEPRITSGTLTDTAHASGSDGQSADSNTVNVGIDSTATVTLTVDKTRSPVTVADQTFHFNVLDSGNNVVGTPSVTVPGGAGTSTVYSSTPLTGLAPGTYTVNEPAQGAYGAQTANATITLPSCSGSVAFNNVAAPAHARVQKITAPSSASMWQFTLSGPDVGTTGTETKSATAGAGYVDFTSALDTDGATYTITETPQTGWDLTTISGDFAGSASRVTTDASAKTCSFTLSMPTDSNGVLSCSFTNTERGSITIIKDAQPDSSQSFGYTATGENLSNFSLVDDGVTAGANTKSFTGLRPTSETGSNYVVSENLPVTGWDFTNLSCTSANGSSSITRSTAQATIGLGAGDAVVCTYTNVERGHVTVVKSQNGATPTKTYTFQLTGGPDSVNISRTTDSTNLGTLDFGLLKPGSYTLCELAVPAGTHSTLQDAPYNGTLDPSTGNVCYSFTLAAGQTLTINVDNQYPQGNALTIGYWRNWNSCSGTGNNRVAMAAKTGNVLMDAFLPVTLATGTFPYTVSSCAQGVSVLSATSAQYAEHQLAAQLLAARLNVAAGASHSSSTDAVIIHAMALLGSINWEGSPTSRIIGPNDPRRADFLNTAAYLNNYNNDLVV